MTDMRIIQVVPKEIEIVFGLSLDSVENLVDAINSAEFDLKQDVPEDKKAFDSVVAFHELLKGLLSEMAKQ